MECKIKTLEELGWRNHWHNKGSCGYSIEYATQTITIDMSDEFYLKLGLDEIQAIHTKMNELKGEE